MALVRCTRGHYYDNKKYIQCPQCGLQINSSDDECMTVKLNQSVNKQPEHIADNIKTMRFVSDESDVKQVGSKGFVTGWLVCISGPEKGRDYRVYYGNNFVGRSFEMDICIREDNKISRERHCSIVYDEKHNTFYLAPGNGITYYEEQLLEKAIPLYENRLITMGESKFYFIPFCTDIRKWKMTD